jgi:hypothetical protein
MLEAGYIWMGVFTAAALMFFGIAIVVAWKGFFDLRELLTRPNKKNGDE